MSYKYPPIFGHAITIHLPVPALGADWAAVPVPGYTVWLVDCIGGRLDTGQTVANRIPVILYVDENNFWTGAAHAAGAVQAASQSVYYTWGLGQTTSHANHTAVTQGYVTAALTEMPLMENYHIDSFTTALQADDQWTEGFMRVRQWLNPHA